MRVSKLSKIFLLIVSVLIFVVLLSAFSSLEQRSAAQVYMGPNSSVDSSSEIDGPVNNPSESIGSGQVAQNVPSSGQDSMKQLNPGGRGTVPENPAAIGPVNPPLGPIDPSQLTPVGPEKPIIAKPVQPAQAPIPTLEIPSRPAPAMPRPMSSPTNPVASPTPVPAQPTVVPVKPTAPPPPPVKSYRIKAGDTLLGIASKINVPVLRIMQMNNLKNADMVYAGQVIQIPNPAAAANPPLSVPADVNLDSRIIPDSEAVFSPSYAGFDIAAFGHKYNGYLMSYQESVDGSMLSGPQIIQEIASRFSVGPRVLLTVLEMNGNWVTNPNPSDSEVLYSMGLFSAAQAGLYNQAFWIAAFLNEGYYGQVSGSLKQIKLADGTRIPVVQDLNPGTVAVQNLFAHITSYPYWMNDISPKGFSATYLRLFGDPFANAIEPLVPADLTQPALRVPWKDGETWFYTSGPHESWADGSPRGAVDFAPGDGPTCVPSAHWVTSAAPGRIVQAEHGRVIENLDGTNFQGNGWSLMYMHMGSDGRVAVGSDIKTGENIGHPSCEGGVSTADHLHFARLYNGQWIPAGDGPVPMVLSGWVVHTNPDNYDGTITRDSVERDSCDCDTVNVDGIPGDDGSSLAQSNSSN